VDTHVLREKTWTPTFFGRSFRNRRKKWTLIFFEPPFVHEIYGIVQSIGYRVKDITFANNGTARERKTWTPMFFFGKIVGKK
jgi:hypothetical protein